MDFNNIASVRGFVKQAQESGASATETLALLQKAASGNPLARALPGIGRSSPGGPMFGQRIAPGSMGDSIDVTAGGGVPPVIPPPSVPAVAAPGAAAPSALSKYKPHAILAALGLGTYGHVKNVDNANQARLDAIDARETASHANHVQAAKDAKQNSLSFENIKKLLLDTAREHPYLTGAGIGATALGGGLLASRLFDNDEEDDSNPNLPAGAPVSSQPGLS